MSETTARTVVRRGGGGVRSLINKNMLVALSGANG